MMGCAFHGMGEKGEGNEEQLEDCAIDYYAFACFDVGLGLPPG